MLGFGILFFSPHPEPSPRGGREMLGFGIFYLFLFFLRFSPIGGVEGAYFSTFLPLIM